MDHLAVKMVLCTKNVNRGKGVWKFNNSLLKDKIYTLRINEIINNYCEKYSSALSSRRMRDLCKNQIRSYTISYCSFKKMKKPSFCDLENKMNRVETDLL